MAERVPLARKSVSAFLLVALLASGGLTAVVFAAPSLVTLGFFLLILPGIILALTPTVFFYLLIFSVAWFVLSRRHSLLAAGMGLVVVAATALLLPEALNQSAGRELAGAAREEVDEPGALGAQTWRTVALQPLGHPTRAVCNDLCRLLLYNGEVERVIVLSPSEPPPARRRPAAPPPPTAFRIERAGACAADKEMYRLNRGDLWLAGIREEDLNSAIRMRAATGECLVKEVADGAAAALTIRLIRQRDPASAAGLRLWPAEVARSGIELLAGGQVILRKVAVRTAFFASPLHLAPIENGLGMSGWKWGRRSYRAGEEVDVAKVLREAAGFNLNVPAGSSPKALRSELEAALSRPEVRAGDAAFSLTEDFIRGLRPEVSHEDAARLARIVRDPRFTAFGLLPDSALGHESAARPVRDAMLDRLTALTPEKNRRGYRQLEERIDALPPGAFGQPDPRVEALLSDPAVRADSPHLVVRLAERGPSAAPLLLEIMRTRWASKQTRFDWWDRDAQAALAGLCRLGTEAREYLPELRRLEQSGLVPAYLPPLPLWRATLVALGARPEEFTPPGRERPGDYRRRLVELSRRCPLR